MRSTGRTQRGHRSPARALPGLLAAVALSLSLAGGARAEEYRPDRAGNPVRVAAYLLHPLGVIVDYTVLRPAYWIGGFEPFRTLFGVQRRGSDEPAPTAPVPGD